MNVLKWSCSYCVKSSSPRASRSSVSERLVLSPLFSVLLCAGPLRRGFILCAANELRNKLLWCQYPEWWKAWWFVLLDLEKGSWKVVTLLSRYQQKAAGPQVSSEDSVPGGCKHQEPSLRSIWAMAQDMHRSSDLLLPILALDTMPRAESLHLFFLDVKKKLIITKELPELSRPELHPFNILLPTENPNSYGKP